VPAPMPFADYLSGLLVWGIVAACAAGTAALALRGRAGDVRGTPRLLAHALVFICATLGSYWLPGALAVLGRGSVVLAALAILAAAWFLRERDHPGVAAPSRPRAAGAGRIDWVIAGTAVAVVAWLVLAALVERAPVAPTNLDALNFHLPGIGAWIEEGGFWQVSQWVPDLAHGNYPQNGDLLDLSVVLPWHNDAFVRLVSVPLLAMAGLAVYAIGRELGATRPSAVLWAAAFASVPAVLHPAALEVLTDTMLLACLGTGGLFLLRHHRTGATADLVLAGVGLGLAFGTKWYGVSSVVVVLVVWAGGNVLARQPPGVLARRFATLAGLIAAAGGFWLLRNWVESGNPLFPVRAEVLGVTLLDAPFDYVRAMTGFTVASYLDDPGALADYILPALEKTVAIPGLLLGTAAIAALVLGLRDRSRPGADPRIPAMAVASLLLAAAYSVTPYSALGVEGRPLFTEFNVRYLVPALMAAAPLAAWLPARLPALASVWALAGLAATAQAAHFTAEEIGGTPLAQAAVAIVVAGAAAAAAALWLRRRRVRLPGRAALLGASALAALIAVAAGQVVQSRFNDSRYAGVDPVLDLAGEGKLDGRKIGLVGVWGVTRESPVWPMFGQRLDNEVVYVGDFREGMLRDYADRRGLLRGIREDGVDHLLVARGEPAVDHARAEAWARSGGLRQVLRSDRFTLFRVPASGVDLSPAGAGR
jgi:hypothetical protein